MVITKTPLRISFLGGGTDYPDWYEKHGGLVVGGTIDKYSHIIARKTPKYASHKTKLIYSETEIVDNNKDIKHRAIKAALSYMDMMDVGLELICAADIPDKSGTGSSSTFVVGLLNTLHQIKYGGPLSPYQSTCEAIHIERTILKETVGSQDQAWAAHGGVRAFRFMKGLDFVPTECFPTQNISELNKYTLLFFTGIKRIASHVSETYANKLLEFEDAQQQMIALAENGIANIYLKNWKKLGQNIDEAWTIKKSLSPSISTNEIDSYYNKAIDAGAYGGKLIGAGGGGCLFFIAHPSRHTDIKIALDKLVEIDFNFTSRGSEVIFDGENNSNSVGIL